ncbi:hypothetical protein MRX96_009618 [Rhipicephalus microplus]
MEANALAPPPTSPPKGHRLRSRARRSQSKSRRKSQGRAFGILKQHARNRIENQHHHPGTDSPKEQSREFGETRITTSRKASARWTDAPG